MSFWAALGTAVLGGLSSKYSAKSDAKKDIKQIEAEGKEQRRGTAFEMALADWYKQRDRGEKRDAFKNYTQFSNLSSFAPQYRNVHNPIAMPTKPKPEDKNYG